MALQKKSGSAREKWMAAFLPSVAMILIAFMYINFFMKPDFETVQRKLDAAMGSVVPQAVITELANDWGQLRDDQTELQDTIRSVEDEVTAKSVAYERLSPTAKHLAVTALFKEYQVALLQDQTAEEIRLPKIRGKSIEILRSLLPEEAINFRELTLTADYLTIITLLKKLPEISGVLPVNITLQKTTKVAASEKPNGPSLVWTITLLM